MIFTPKKERPKESQKIVVVVVVVENVENGVEIWRKSGGNLGKIWGKIRKTVALIPSDESTGGCVICRGSCGVYHCETERHV